MNVLTPAFMALVASLLFSVSTGSESTWQNTQRVSGTGVLTGRVMRTDAGPKSPAGRIRVAIDAGDGRSQRQTVADDEGRFTFDRLPAGRYTVTASKIGWVTKYYGSPRPGHPPGIRVIVADGARAEIEVPIIKGSVIAGRIVNAEGRPMARLFPSLVQQRLIGDKKMLARLPEQTIGSFELMTNDLGEFRFFGVTPGTYYVMVTPSIGSNARVTTSDEVRWASMPASQAGQPPAQGPVAGYAMVFYPGTTDPTSARPITVGPGEVREGLELRIEFVSVSRIDGSVLRPDGTPVVGATVTLKDRLAQVSLDGNSRLARTDPAGNFTMSNVPPGDYRLSVRASSAAGTTTPSSVLDLWGHRDVLLSGQDVSNFGISLAPASSISGRLSFSGTSMTPPANLSSVQLMFTSAAELAASLSVAGGASAIRPSAVVNPDGTFRAVGLPPDRYIAAASWPDMRTGDGTVGWWLTSVTVDGKDIGDRPIEVAPNQSVTNVTLEFRDRIGSIEGLLTDAAGTAAPGYFVLAFPAEREFWTTTSRRVSPAVQSGTDGRYRIVGVPPGEYFLAVVSSAGREDYADPEFLEALVPAAMRIKVSATDVSRMDLKIK